MSLNVREARVVEREELIVGRAMLVVRVPGLDETLRGLSDEARDVILDVLTTVLWERFRWDGWRLWEALPAGRDDLLEMSLRR